MVQNVKISGSDNHGFAPKWLGRAGQKFWPAGRARGLAGRVGTGQKIPGGVMSPRATPIKHALPSHKRFRTIGHGVPQSGTKVQIRRPGPTRRGRGPGCPIFGLTRPGPGTKVGPVRKFCLAGWAENSWMGRAPWAQQCHSGAPASSQGRLAKSFVTGPEKRKRYRRTPVQNMPNYGKYDNMTDYDKL